MKRAVLAMVLIVLIVLIAAVSVSAYRWGGTRYGAVYYYGSPNYMYYPTYYPAGSGIYYEYPAGPLSSDWVYRYGTPPKTPQIAGQLCGLVDGEQYGCSYGFLCDYGKTTVKGLGVCIPSNTL